MTSKIAWQVDEDWRISNVAVHDTRLVKISVSDDKGMELVIRNSGAQLTRFSVSGISYLNLHLCKGTIISEVYIWPVSAIPEQIWDVPDSGWNALFAGPCKSLNPRADAERIKMKLPNASLIQFDSSYGGSIVAICEAVEVFLDQ